MSDLSGKFATLEEQLAAQAAATDSILTGISDLSAAIYAFMDIMNTNAAANTKYLLAALQSGVNCIDCADIVPIVPPYDDTVNPINNDKCQRVQALLHFINQALTIYDGASAFSVGWNPTLIKNAIDAAIAGLENGEPIPNMSFPELVQGAGDLANYILANITVGGTLTGYFAEIQLDAQNAMFAASTPEAARNAFNSVIDGSDIPAAAAAVLKDAAYASAVNYFLDPSTNPNLTGYSGGVCTFPIGTCITLTGVLTHNVATGANIYGVNVPFASFSPNVTTNTSSGPATFTEPIWYEGDLAGWTYETLTGEMYVQYRTGNLASSGLFNTTGIAGAGTGVHNAPHPTGTFGLLSGIAFTVRLCYTG